MVTAVKSDELTPFPRPGDQILRVDGHTLRDPDDKMREVTGLLRAGVVVSGEDEGFEKTRPEPLRVLFMPGDDPHHVLEFDEDGHDARDGKDAVAMDAIAELAHSPLLAKLARQTEAAKRRPGEDPFLTLLARLRNGILFQRFDHEQCFDLERAPADALSAHNSGRGCARWL